MPQPTRRAFVNSRRHRSGLDSVVQRLKHDLANYQHTRIYACNVPHTLIKQHYIWYLTKSLAPESSAAA